VGSGVLSHPVTMPAAIVARTIHIKFFSIKIFIGPRVVVRSSTLITDRKMSYHSRLWPLGHTYLPKHLTLGELPRFLGDGKDELTHRYGYASFMVCFMKYKLFE